MNPPPRCPFAGATPEDIRGCPGFTLETVPGGDVHGDGITHETCAHLGPENDGRGFYPACHHPDAAWMVPTLQVMVRRRDVRAEVVLRTSAVLARTEPAQVRRRSEALFERAAAAQLNAAQQVGHTRMLQHMRRAEMEDRAAEGSRA